MLTSNSNSRKEKKAMTTTIIKAMTTTIITLFLSLTITGAGADGPPSPHGSLIQTRRPPQPEPPGCYPCLLGCHDTSGGGTECTVPPTGPSGDMWRIVERHQGACEVDMDVDGVLGTCEDYRWHCNWAGLCEDTDGLSWTDAVEAVYGLCSFEKFADGCTLKCGSATGTCLLRPHGAQTDSVCMFSDGSGASTSEVIHHNVCG